MSVRSFVVSIAAALSLAASAEALVTERAPANGTLDVTLHATNDGAHEAAVGSSLSISHLDGSLETRIALSSDAAQGTQVSLPAGLYQVRWELDALSEIDAELSLHESAPRLVVVSPGTQSSVVLRPRPARTIAQPSAGAERLALR